jgi:hypothetical protein
MTLITTPLWAVGGSPFRLIPLPRPLHPVLEPCHACFRRRFGVVNPETSNPNPVPHFRGENFARFPSADRARGRPIGPEFERVACEGGPGRARGALGGCRGVGAIAGGSAAACVPLIPRPAPSARFCLADPSGDALRWNVPR